MLWTKNDKLMSSFIQVREKGAKKAKKNGFCQNKKSYIETTRHFIKNPLGYVFYQFDTIKKKKQF